MTAPTVRSVVSDLTGHHVALSERDRLMDSEELVHLCNTYQQLTYAARAGDAADVWDARNDIQSIINRRLADMDWRDSEVDE